MKVALVHDYIKEYGGAERVLEALHELYPHATVYTSVYLPEYLGPHRERFAKWKIKTSYLQYIPGSAKLISPFRLLAPFAFRQFDLSSYDVVIVSATGAYFPNFIRTKNKSDKGAIQICYCHTPPRYLYGYATARDWKKNKLLGILGEAANHILRIVDGYASNHVDFYVANSEEVAARIKKFYRRDATVIYPPVDLPEEKKQSSNSRSYYLTGGRLARAKHVDLLVRTATKLGLKLKVFGKDFAGYGHELEMLAGPTVEFLGEVSDEQKRELMSQAKAFLFASEDEDFGIVPVEAMGEGTPVIAYKSGGVKETVVDGKTGVFFDELSIESLSEAVKRFEKRSISSSECVKQAKKFGKDRFMKEMKVFVSSKTK
jgi:glycosyltransferase involved in cell wall biosynthesis